MQRILTTTALIAFVGTGSALAACPTAADMEGPGVVIEYSDNWSTRFERGPNGTMFEISAVGGTEDYYFESEMGIHVIAEGPWKDGGPVVDQMKRFSLPESVALPKPATNMSWNAVYDMQNPDGSVEKTETAVSSGGMAKMTIGKCTYDVIPMHFVFNPANDTGTISALSYMPDLGILVLTATGEVGGVYNTFFTPIDIKRKGQ